MSKTSPQATGTKPTASKRLPFSQNKDVILEAYKRTLGAFCEELDAFEFTYGVPFDPEDTRVPDAFKHYYRLVGLRSVIQDRELLDAIAIEIAGENVLNKWGVRDA